MAGGTFAAPDTAYAELWLPTGATGPKYLLFKNFDVFKAYNRSDSYAFSVGLLTDGVAGQNGPVAVWPTELELLTRRDIMVLQNNLNRLGFDAGAVDGIAGRGTKGALRRFQKASGIVPLSDHDRPGSGAGGELALDFVGLAHPGRDGFPGEQRHGDQQAHTDPEGQ